MSIIGSNITKPTPKSGTSEIIKAGEQHEIKQNRPQLTLIEGGRTIAKQVETKLTPLVQSLIKKAKSLPSEEVRMVRVDESNMPEIPKDRADIKPSDLIGQPQIKLNGGITITTVPISKDNGGIANIEGQEPSHIKSEQYSVLMKEIQNTGKLNSAPEAKRVAVAA